MVQTLLEMAKDLTHSLVEAGRLSAEDLQDALQKTYATLTTLKVQEEAGTPTTLTDAEPLPVDWRKSITRHTVTCLACGDTLKQLSIRHLRMHGLDLRSYRTKYGIPRSQPLAARTTTERRRQVVQETRPWEQAPAYRKSQARQETALPEPEETEAPSVAASAQPKRQRKTTSKKKAAPKTRAQG
jgi:predicted transcriptional regulator